MASTVDEITICFSEEDGTLITKELDKEVLTKGSWATILFKFQDLDRASGTFKAPKFSIRRYQKRSGEYKTMSKFNISSTAQAKKIIEVLSRWTENEAAEDGPDEGEG